MIVVADTGPINYLILSGHIELIHELYGSVLLPPAVHRELIHPRAPALVRDWASNLPRWTDIRSPLDPSPFPDLGLGEREAIALVLDVAADFVLMDESLGRRTAVAARIAVKGCLGVLEDAAAKGLVTLPEAIHQLRSTSIFLSDEVIERVLSRHEARKRERSEPRPPAP